MTQIMAINDYTGYALFKLVAKKIVTLFLMSKDSLAAWRKGLRQKSHIYSYIAHSAIQLALLFLSLPFAV